MRPNDALLSMLVAQVSFIITIPVLSDFLRHMRLDSRLEGALIGVSLIAEIVANHVVVILRRRGVSFLRLYVVLTAASLVGLLFFIVSYSTRSLALALLGRMLMLASASQVLHALFFDATLPRERRERYVVFLSAALAVGTFVSYVTNSLLMLAFARVRSALLNPYTAGAWLSAALHVGLLVGLRRGAPTELLAQPRAAPVATRLCEWRAGFLFAFVFAVNLLWGLLYSHAFFALDQRYGFDSVASGLIFACICLPGSIYAVIQCGFCRHEAPIWLAVVVAAAIGLLVSERTHFELDVLVFVVCNLFIACGLLLLRGRVWSRLHVRFDGTDRAQLASLLAYNGSALSGFVGSILGSYVDRAQLVAVLLLVSGFLLALLASLDGLLDTVVTDAFREP